MSRKRPVRESPDPRRDKPLTPKQTRFVLEYLLDLNATAAYRRAGYTARNDNVASVSAHNLLSISKVQIAIQAAFQARSVRTEITADYVIHRLQAEAELNGDGSSHSARVRALELLGKHLGMFVDRMEHRHGGDPSNPTPIPLTPVKELTNDERIARLNELAERIQSRRAGSALPNGASRVRPTAGAD